MHQNQEEHRSWLKRKFEPQYVLFFFSLMVLLIIVIAFARPVYPFPLQSTAQPSCTAAVQTGQTQTENGITPTPSPELIPPSPEEVGYTNGIIFWATILMFILFAATVREIWRRKAKNSGD
jgi:cbb3-type cytochrome oxidase subunit 3